MSQNKRWGIYCRVSTSDQINGLDSQMRAMVDFVDRQGVKNYEIYSDHGISGAKESRPSLNRMMEDANDGKLSHIAVYSFSRFARSTTHLLRALETFQKLGVEFISFTEQIQTNSPMGRAFFTVIAAIAQLERELICERVKNGLKAARARGAHIGRKKQRDSVLIRRLLKAGLSYRAIAAISKSSHGSVWAEKKSLLKEIAEQKRLQEEEQKAVEEAIKTGAYFGNAPGILNEGSSSPSSKSPSPQSVPMLTAPLRDVTELDGAPLVPSANSQSSEISEATFSEAA